jgi:hypothetical protein
MTTNNPSDDTRAALRDVRALVSTHTLTDDTRAALGAVRYLSATHGTILAFDTAGAWERY